MHTHINGNIAQLRPAHGMVQVVLAKVVLGQVGDVGELHVRNVRRLEWANIHFWSCGVSCAEGRSLLFLFWLLELRLVMVVLGWRLTACWARVCSWRSVRMSETLVVALVQRRGG
jgi:hypothetical protein